MPTRDDFQPASAPMAADGDEDRAARPARVWLAPVLLSALVVVSYVRTLGYGLFFDDNVMIRPWSLRQVVDAFHGPFDLGPDPYFRPLASASFAADWQVWHTNTWGYHLTNLALHLAAVLLLYHLLRRLKVPVAAATLGAAYFALLPSNAATVLWIAERTDAVCAITIVGTVLLLRRYENEPRLTLLVGMNALFLIGLLFKEQASSLIGVVIVFMVYFGMSRADGAEPESSGLASHWRREGRLAVRVVTDRARVRERLLVLGTLTGTLLVYLVWRALAVGSRTLSNQVTAGSPPRAFAEGVWAVIKGVPWEVPSNRIAVVLVVGIVATFVVSPRSRWWRLFLAGAGVVVAGAIPVALSGGAEPRLLYVASIGIAMMVASIASTWGEWLTARRVEGWRMAAVVAGGALVLALALVPLLTQAQDQFEPTSEMQLRQALVVYQDPEQRALVEPSILRELEQRLIDAGRLPARDGDD